MTKLILVCSGISFGLLLFEIITGQLRWEIAYERIWFSCASVLVYHWIYVSIN